MNESRLNFTSQGDGRSVVLLHGFPFDRRVWSEQMAALSAVARVVALDLPGFGKSPMLPAEVEPSMDEYAKAIASTASDLRLGKLVLVGHSMSGYVALAFARRYPEMLTGLALVTTKPAADSKKAKEGRTSLAAKVREVGAAATVSAMGAKLVAPATNERDPRILDRAKDIMLDQRTEGIVAALTAMARRPSSTSSLSNIGMPTLVIRGEEDALMPTRSVNSLARGIPSARLEVMRGAGHLPMMETPDQFNTALQSFLTKIQSQ